MGAPVLHAAANDKLPDQLFVALAAPDEAGEGAPTANSVVGKGKARAALSASTGRSQVQLAGVYVVSLRAARSATAGTATTSSAAASAPSSPSTPVPPARRVRLAVPRHVRALALSPSGTVLASLTPTHVHLCQTAQLNKGFVKSVDAPIDGERFTTVAFHPTENIFATGNEKGQIRVWYNVLPRPAPTEGGDAQMDLADADMGAEPSSSVLHWHAHAVASLAFTPNGAYLLSGGREAVLVLWQLHSGHQEYVPRLGSEIETLTVLEANASEGGEQQVAVRLRDGSTVFVGSQRLKIVKTIAGLKSGAFPFFDISRKCSGPTDSMRGDCRPVHRAFVVCTDCRHANRPARPACDRSRNFSSRPPFGTPFFPPILLSQLGRSAARTRNLSLEPRRERQRHRRTDSSRTGRVFETGLGGRQGRVLDGDCRLVVPGRLRECAAAQVLAEARRSTGVSMHSFSFALPKLTSTCRSFVLSTRIDRPHEAPITSIAFSPSSASPLLLTTSTDGRIKVWGPSSASEGAWQCRASLSYRSSAPVASAWSHDGSLFAVAHTKRTVTLWSVANAGQLVHAFPATAIGRPKSICFADKEGTQILCAGSSGAVCWDLLTLEGALAFSLGGCESTMD